LLPIGPSSDPAHLVQQTLLIASGNTRIRAFHLSSETGCIGTLDSESDGNIPESERIDCFFFMLVFLHVREKTKSR
jgi:hypothetical protein